MTNTDTPRVTWTEDGNVVLPMLPAYDTDGGEARREALNQDDTAWQLIAATSWVLDGIGRMRRRLGPELPSGVYAAADELIRIGQAMKDELALSTMATLGDVARIEDIPRATAQSRRRAIRASEDTMSDEDREYRHRIGYRPRGEDARTWYQDSYYEQNEADEARWLRDAATWRSWRGIPDPRNVVVNVATGTVGIQSAGSVTGGTADVMDYGDTLAHAVEILVRHQESQWSTEKQQQVVTEVSDVRKPLEELAQTVYELWSSRDADGLAAAGLTDTAAEAVGIAQHVMRESLDK